MRVGIYSHAPWAPSGYGQITNELSLELTKNDIETFCIAIDYSSTPQQYNHTTVMGTIPAQEQAPKDLYYWTRNLNLDIVIQLFDAWVIQREWIDPTNIPILVYNPIDCTPPPKYFKEATKGAKKHIAMSEFAIKQMRKEHIGPSVYLPHSIYTSFFRPLNKNHKEKHGIPKDSFIFGLVGTNLTARKNLPNQILSFAHFLNRNPHTNAYLYIHSIASRKLITSYDIIDLIKQLNIADRVLITNQNALSLNGIDKVTMLELYNSFDVLLSCSLGEGFGIPIIEAGACGVPAIVNDFSAMPYTMGEGGLKVTKGTWWLDPSTRGWQKIPSIKETTEKMEELYYDHKLLNSLKKKAIKNARKYDWSIWTPKWIQLLQEETM